MRRKLDWILLVTVLVVAGILAYTHQTQVRGVVQMIEVKIAPCANPVTYSISSIDPRFGISESVLIKNLKEAEDVWENPSEKNLFEYKQSGGDITISLVYDARQAATDKLKLSGIQLSKSKESYEELKAMYNALSLRVESELSEYKNQAAAYKLNEDAYNAEVEEWNKKGGAPKAVYERLQAEQAALAQAFAGVKSLESAMNADIDTLNALATTLNQLIVQLNLNVAQYNREGASSGEFEEGLYRLSGGLQTIDVYEYSNQVKLVRILAHEMGHALGLDHVSDAGAIMYKINSGTNLTTTVADTAELNRVCKTGA